MRLISYEHKKPFSHKEPVKLIVLLEASGITLCSYPVWVDEIRNILKKDISCSIENISLFLWALLTLSN